MNNKSISKGLLRITKQIYKKGGINQKLQISKIILKNGAILRETLLLLLPKVKHFSKERKGNQPRLRK
jgi:hypothetical protein